MLFSFTPVGFEGTLCERNIDDCSPDPCHHGTCVDGIASFACTCLAGYTGYRCENQINECHSNPCQHGGKCIDLVNKYLCHCQPGTSGRISLPSAPRIREWNKEQFSALMIHPYQLQHSCAASSDDEI